MSVVTVAPATVTIAMLPVKAIEKALMLMLTVFMALAKPYAAMLELKTTEHLDSMFVFVMGEFAETAIMALLGELTSTMCPPAMIVLRTAALLPTTVTVLSRATTYVTLGLEGASVTERILANMLSHEPPCIELDATDMPAIV